MQIEREEERSLSPLSSTLGRFGNSEFRPRHFFLCFGLSELSLELVSFSLEEKTEQLFSVFLSKQALHNSTPCSARLQRQQRAGGRARCSRALLPLPLRRR